MSSLISKSSQIPFSNSRVPCLARTVFTMQFVRPTYFVFIVVITIMTLSVTVVKGGKSAVTGQENVRQKDVADRKSVV